MSLETKNMKQEVRNSSCFKKMLVFLTSFALLLIAGSLSTFAITVNRTVDGIKYSCDTKTETATVIGCDEQTTNIKIPASITGNFHTYKVIAIGDRAFYGKTKLNNVDLSACKELKTIGKRAFARSTALKYVDFSGCTNLTTIGNSTFAECPELTSVKLSGCTNITSIGNSAFWGTNLSELDLSNCTSLTTIEVSAFGRCENLKKLDLTNCINLASIGRSAFMNCSSLDTVCLTGCENLTSIEENTFANCTSLTELDLSSLTKITKIGKSAFHGCINLTTLDLSACTNLETIEQSAFEGCSNLEKLDFSNLKKLISIGNYAFRYCDNLRSVTIPNSTYVSRTAFESCYAEKISVDTGNNTRNAITIVEDSWRTANIVLQDQNGAFAPGKLTVTAKALEKLSNLDSTHPVEYVHAFEITPYVNGQKFSGKLDKKVRLLYEIPNGWDLKELQAVLMQPGSDIEFEEQIETIGGKKYIAIWTDHFSPYAFIDVANPKEQAASSKSSSKKAPQTGENNTVLITAVAFLLLSACLSLGLFLQKRKKFEN